MDFTFFLPLSGWFSIILPRRWEHTLLKVILFQFLVAYCSYPEDSSHYSHYSNSSTNVTSGKRRRGVKLVAEQGLPQAAALRDAIPSEDQQQFFPSPGKAVLPARESHSDIYMAPEDGFRTPTETIAEEKSALSAFLMELCEPSQKSGASTEAVWPQRPDCSSPMDIEPSESSAFLENSITAALLPEWDSSVCEQTTNVSSSTMYHWTRKKKEKKNPFMSPKRGSAVLIMSIVLCLVFNALSKVFILASSGQCWRLYSRIQVSKSQHPIFNFSPTSWTNLYTAPSFPRARSWHELFLALTMVRDGHITHLLPMFSKNQSN